MPFMTPDTTDQHDALAVFAAQQIRQVATALYELTPEQLALTPSASGMSLGALARHMIAVTGNILGGIEAAPAAYEPPGTPEQQWAEGTIAPEALRAGDTAEQLMGELTALAERADALIRALDLEAEVPVPDQPWFADASRWNARFCLLHLIEEGARHAGHADILRESIDGKTAYELNARVDGQPWPPAGW